MDTAPYKEYVDKLVPLTGVVGGYGTGALGDMLSFNQTQFSINLKYAKDVQCRSVGSVYVDELKEVIFQKVVRLQAMSH
jgi:hypothetical protein